MWAIVVLDMWQEVLRALLRRFYGQQASRGEGFA
jgi:hypothetical protein